MTVPFFIDKIPSGAEYYPRGEFFRQFVPNRVEEFLSELQVLDTRVTCEDLVNWKRTDAAVDLTECFAVKDIQESNKRGEALCSLCIFKMEVDELHTGKTFQDFVDGVKFWIEVFRDSRKAQTLRVYVGDSAWDELHQQGVLAAKDVNFVRMSHSSIKSEIGVFWRYLAFDDYDYEYVYIDETDGEGEFVDGKWMRAEDKIKSGFLYDRKAIERRLETPKGFADFSTPVLPVPPVEIDQGLLPNMGIPLFFVSEDYRLSDPWFIYRLSEYVQTGSPLLTRGPNQLPFSMARMLAAHFERGTERILYHPSINAWCNVRERHPNLNYRYTDDQWLFHLTKVLKINMKIGGLELLKCYADQKRFGDAFFIKRIYDALERDGNYLFIPGKKEEGNPFNFSQSQWDQMQNYDVLNKEAMQFSNYPDTNFTFLRFKTVDMDMINKEFPFRNLDAEKQIIGKTEKRWPQIPRLGSRNESVALYELAAGFHDSLEGYVVECGVFAGGSAIHMARALKEYQSTYNTLIAIDPYAINQEVLPVVHSILQKLDFNKHVCQILYPDLDFISEFWKLPTRMFHLDSLHEYDHVTNQLNLCFPLLLNGGWLAIHDYNAEDVAQAVNEFVNTNRSCLSAFRVDNLVLLRKEE